jgi:rubrerythrin
VTTVKSLSRAALFGASSAIALVGMPLMAGFVEAAEHADAADVSTLNAAIALELAAIKAYQDALGTGLLTPSVAAIASRFTADHGAHRDALAAAVTAAGARPAEATAWLTYPPLNTQDDILRFAMVVERKAASTYLSVVPDLKDRRLAGLAAAILGVETTHVSTLASALGVPGYVSGFVV